MYSFRATIGPDSPDGVRVEVAFTDASVDLQGRRPGFAATFAALVEDAGVPFARLSQVHGDHVVHVVDDPPGPGEDAPSADALVTTRRDVGLMIRAADCVPVLLADPVAGVIGAVHSGRIGTALDVSGRTVEAMRALGAADLQAWIGPHVCGRCYEVPEQLRDEVAAIVPATRSETSWGTPALDLGAGVAAQLAAAGVPAVNVDRCTLEDERLHSYRRDGADSGRLAGLVWFA
ncbi:MAG TPA: laccase [Nocardioides bacterium]|uniref:polyphenol oxidase family protein n=1 Tax=uncultured Nocardioides sp. TaxID=198441 RepID=UPI000ECD0941|nr:polyphenol oxidase family protein [uncultured Nocardioides sp.]HCB05186.1 laccase [Nocardioides sp.]HRD63625.1 polyphenol oxidase family protein [Nocardioides sp.]